MMKGEERLPIIFKALNSVKDKLGEEMVEEIRDMVVGYLYYKEGTEIMGNRMARREGVEDCYYPEKEKK